MMDNTDGNIGRILKQRREELGRTLQNAEEDTRIRKTYLESLENNRFSELPGQAYVTGFIRLYAGYLGLASDPLLALLNDRQSVATGPAEAEPTVGSEPVQRAQHAAGSDWRKFFLAFVLVLLLGCLTYYLAAIFSGDRQVDESATKATTAGETAAVPEKPHAEHEKSPVVPAQPQPTAVEPTRAQGPADQLPAQVAAPPVASPEQQVQDNRTFRTFPAIPPQGASLRMLALTDSSLIIKVDERKPQEYQLHDGLDLTWKVRQKVTVQFAASDVARFWLNGREIDIAGDQSFTLQPAAE